MCLIAHRDTIGAHIPNDVIEYNLRSNPDGFGIAWREPGKGLVYERFGPENATGFRSLLKRIDSSPKEYVAHFRKATHGAKCAALSHPFEYRDPQGNKMLAFHNGVINIKTNGEAESDTSVFVKYVLAKLPHGWWKNSAMVWLVEESIGWSRLLIMSEKEDIIINEDDWKRDGGINYSTHPRGYTPPKSNLPSYLWFGKNDPKVNTGGSGLLLPGMPEESEEESINLSDEDGDDDIGDESSLVSWMNRGHRVVPLTQIDSTSDDDKYGTCRCVVCKSEGDFFVIDGTLYIDIQHLDILDEEDEDDTDMSY
jgi:hypothetical protein